MVLSPELPLIDQITLPRFKDEVISYQQAAAQKSELLRAELAKFKTGVFTGAFAINPANGRMIPIWISDYVLMGYGTGAIMAVPAHDERDEEFANQFELPIERVIDEEGKCINSASQELSLNGLSVQEAFEKVAHWVEKKGMGKRTVHYKLRDWLFSRQRYWGEPFPILHFEDGSVRALELDELPLEPPEMIEYKPSPTGESPLAKVKEWIEVVDEKTGRRVKRESNTMPQWAGSCWYYLRFCDPRNDQEAWSQEKEKYWMPVDLYVGGAEHAVLHLLYARFWHKVLYDCGFVTTLEPFQRLVNQGLIVARSYQKANGLYVTPQEVVEREGRYFHWESGEELRSQIDKMSKSKLNGVSPDDVIAEFGADALRLYSMFMGPVEKEKVWNTEGVSGCRRFLNRFFEMATSDKVVESGESKEIFVAMKPVHKLAHKLAHKLVQGATEDIDNLLFNTAIAKLMEFLNEFTKLPLYPKQCVKMAVQVLAPLAPHLAEELWEYLGEEGSVAHAPWPQFDPALLIEEETTYVIQINGKVRAKYQLPVGMAQNDLLKIVHDDATLAKYLEGKMEKVIFVPEKLLNIVIEP